MKTQDAIQLAGSPTMLARILGVSPSAVSQYGDDLPDVRALQLYTLRPEWFTGRPIPVVKPKVGKKRNPEAESA